MIKFWAESLLSAFVFGAGFDALSYYSDHQKEIQKYIEENRVPDKLIDPLVQSTQ